ncbi:MAG: capsular biosynthesis protein, partial [Oxalobacteraceae bacterium]
RARDELAKVDGEIQAEIRRVMSNLEARVQVAGQRASAASGIASASRGELAANTSASVELNELERRADALRTNYNALLQRQTIVASQAIVADADARPLSPALPPEQPSSPNRKLDAALAVAIALLLAGGTVMVLQLFDQTLVSSREAEEALGLRHVVNVPALASIAAASDQGMAPIDYVVERPLSPLAEAMRSLLFAIENEGHGEQMRVVGITSARAGEGKSTTAACLARIAAISGRRTLLIDGDIRRPSIASIFGLSPQVGLTEVLAEEGQVRDALLRDERSGAYILPSLIQRFEHRHINSEANLHQLMQRIGQVFDIVIIDTAPSLAAVESRLLMNFVDQAFMVVRWKHTPVPIVRSALRRLASVRVRMSGIIMTQVNMKAVAAYAIDDVAIDDVDHEYQTYTAPVG